MSKAFTREDAGVPDPEPVVRSVPVLPPGVKNLITARGAEALRKELMQPGITSARAVEVQRILQSAVVQPPPPKPWDEVAFGATVTVRDANETEDYRLVGADETDLERNRINWCSPLAQVLIGGRVGQRVRFRERELEILEIAYD
ncbi:MAG TPA: GreA/GreB family elongation factor [Verrucomicrobiae bacterium]|nr:GreA/GreB family elongation factor [Verrucomicrobiae bacterium]